jgi:hypothetical protein
MGDLKSNKLSLRQFAERYALLIETMTESSHNNKCPKIQASYDDYGVKQTNPLRSKLYEHDGHLSLARVMLLEWQDSQRKIKASPNIKFHDKEVLTELTSKFPNAGKKSYSNGMISFKLTLEHHLKGKDL